MYPGLLSTLIPNQQKKPVNRYDYRPLKPQYRIGRASYHQPQLYGGIKPFGKGMSFHPQLHVELTLPDPYLKNSNAKPRLKWSHELQDRFIQSVDALGGEKYATPKKILLMMNATGLTLSHLKSHLQKYRIALRKPVALPSPPRRPRANPKNKASSCTAASGHRGSSSSTKKFGANKWKAESSKAREQNGKKQLKIQDAEMAMEGTSKTGGYQPTVASAFASRKGKEPASQARVGNHAVSAYAFASAKGKDPASQTMGNQIIGASAFASIKGKKPAVQTMGNQIIGKSAFASAKVKEPAIQTLGNQVICASAFASSKGKEPATDFEANRYPLPPSIFDIQFESYYPTDFETDPYPLRPSIFDIQFENYYPIHYLREEVIVQNGNVAGASVKEQIAIYQPLGQASISRNLAYLNHSTPDSNSSFQLAGRSTILANYQMDTGSSFSSMFKKSTDPGSSLSTMFENYLETGSSFSSTFVELDTGSNLSAMFENSMETGSSVSSMLGNSSSSLSSTFGNSVDTGSSFSSMFWDLVDPGSGSSSMFANPMETGSSFPIMEPGSGFFPRIANPNPMEPGSSFPSVTATLMNPGLSFSSMGTGSSQSSTFGDPLDTAGSSLRSTFGNSMETGPSISKDLGTSISNLDENGLITGDFGLDSGDFFGLDSGDFFHGITGMSP